LSQAPLQERQSVLKALESLRNLAYVPSEYLDFRIALLKAQLELFDCIQIKSTQTELPLGPQVLNLEPEPLAEMLMQTGESLLKETKAYKDLFRLVEFRMLPDLVLASAFGPDEDALKNFSDQTGVPIDALLFYGRALSAPYLRKILLSIEHEKLEPSDDNGRCPFCDSEPGLSMLIGKTGTRALVCPLCGMQWEFPRLSCPFCMKTNSLEQIREQDNALRWLEACSSCHQYLKMIDGRKIEGEIIPLKESVGTLYLDIIAQKQGLKPRVPYVALR